MSPRYNQPRIPYSTDLKPLNRIEGIRVFRSDHTLCMRISVDKFEKLKHLWEDSNQKHFIIFKVDIYQWTLLSRRHRQFHAAGGEIVIFGVCGDETFGDSLQTSPKFNRNLRAAHYCYSRFLQLLEENYGEVSISRFGI
jgi:hypothetical protein